MWYIINNYFSLFVSCMTIKLNQPISQVQWGSLQTVCWLHTCLVYFHDKRDRCVLVNLHCCSRGHFINVSLPGPDNRAQTYETNRESKFYPVKDLYGAATVLAPSVATVISGEAWRACHSRDRKQSHSAITAVVTLTQVTNTETDRCEVWDKYGFSTVKSLMKYSSL